LSLLNLIIIVLCLMLETLKARRPLRGTYRASTVTPERASSRRKFKEPCRRNELSHPSGPSSSSPPLREMNNFRSIDLCPSPARVGPMTCHHWQGVVASAVSRSWTGCSGASAQYPERRKVDGTASGHVSHYDATGTCSPVVSAVVGPELGTM
jgi:hypothetical protein